VSSATGKTPFPRTPAEFARYRIWDCYGLLSWSRGAAAKSVSQARSIEDSFQAIRPQLDRFAIERFCPLLRPTPDDAADIVRCLERWPNRLLGFATVHATDVQVALADLDRWIKDGPMVGIYLPSSAQNVPCTHPNYDPIMRRAHELGAVIQQHTWFKTQGKDSSGESTPSELAELARRHPDITFVCVHAGGEWEKGIRAVRDCGNIVVETSGFDPTAGFIEMAVRELGASRIVYGGHAPSRSFGTELSKVLGANISEADKFLILGGNFRRLLTPLLRRRGWSLT
jgi:predicted TIM-barrel fold metal-dependent hydrolase